MEYLYVSFDYLHSGIDFFLGTVTHHLLLIFLVDVLAEECSSLLDYLLVLGTFGE